MHSSVATRSGLLSVTDKGAGPITILFLHGNSACRSVFQEQIDAFSGRFRVVAVDYAGHGDSDNAASPSNDYTLAGHATAVEDVLRELGVGPLVVVGISLGGHVALELTASSLDICGLVLAGCPPFAKSSEGLAMAFKPGAGLALSGKETLTNDDVENFVDLIGPGPGKARDLLRTAIGRTDGRARGALVAGLLAPGARDQKQLAEALSVPIALINGTEDELIDLDYLEGLAYRRLWRGTGHRISGASHAPHTSHPLQFNELLSDFMAEVTAV